MLLNHFRELLSLFPLDPCNFFGPSAAQALRALVCVEITFFFLGQRLCPLARSFEQEARFLNAPPSENLESTAIKDRLVGPAEPVRLQHRVWNVDRRGVLQVTDRCV